MGMEYVLFTSFHKNMNVLYPSPKMVQWRGAGHSTTTRDLLGDVITALANKGIKTAFYIALSDGQNFHPNDGQTYYPSAGGIITQDQINTGYYPAQTTTNDATWNNFFNDIIGEMCDRYGSRIEGFYCDSVYNPTTDFTRLKATIVSRNPNLILIGNSTGSPAGYDLNSKECSDIAGTQYGMQGEAPAGYPVVAADVSTWVGYNCHIGVVAGSGWWSSQGDTNTAKFSADTLCQYTALQAGSSTDGGGVSWASGCFGNGSFDPSFLSSMTNAYNLLKPIAAAITNTIPSTSFPTPKYTSIDRLSGGFTATRSIDGKLDYIHVLRPSAGNTLQLPRPADARTFNAALLLASNQPVTLTTNAYGYLLTLTGGQTWDVRDTVIRLTADLPLPVTTTLNPVADCRIMNDGNAVNYTGASDTMGVFQGRDRTLVRFDLATLPPGSTIISATLTIYARTTYGSNPSFNPLEVYRATKTWAETASSWSYWNGIGSSWGNAGGDAVGTNGVQLTGPYAVNTSNPAANAPVSWDVKNLVTAWQNNTVTNQGLLIRQGGTADGGLHFWSREYATASLRPTLTIVYVPSAVGVASNPNPANGATGIATNVSLTWQAGANAVSHQIYFGANSNAVATATIASPEFKGSQVTTNYIPGALATSGRFYWRVDEVGVATSTNCVVWTFATAVNATNKPAIASGINGGNFAVSFPSQIGQTYRVERTDSLSPANWQTVSDNIPGTGGQVQVTDALSGQPRQQFYRIMILSP
jgi:hypothetical protein